MLEIRPCILHLLLATAIAAEIADFGTKPKGENPTLYDYEHDPIVQLDETTFNDTIYGSNQTERTAFMVEFYSDWCGHCRAYAPLYKSLANDVSRWRSVVRIGAINCADPLNEATCRANGVQFFPLIKYFPRNSSGDSDGQKLKTYQSVALMRDQLTQAIVAENDQHHFPDWPNFEPLKPLSLACWVNCLWPVGSTVSGLLCQVSPWPVGSTVSGLLGHLFLACCVKSLPGLLGQLFLACCVKSLPGLLGQLFLACWVICFWPVVSSLSLACWVNCLWPVGSTVSGLLCQVSPWPVGSTVSGLLGHLFLACCVKSLPGLLGQLFLACWVNCFWPVVSSLSLACWVNRLWPVGSTVSGLLGQLFLACWVDCFWPVGIATYNEIFEGVPETIDKKILVFEENPQSLVANQLILDMQQYSDKIAIQKCRKGHPLTEALHISDYPTIAVYKRGEHEPIMQAELRRLLFNEIEEYLGKEGHIAGMKFSSHPHNRTVQTASDSGERNEEEEEKANSTINECERNPESCKARYFASELDMLKAMRYALLREVTRNGGDLSGEKLSSLYTFTDTLANYFPHKTLANNDSADEELFLNASSRARVVFTHMRDFIKQNGLENPLPSDVWKAEFIRAEEDQGKPFPTNADWQHCKGSSPQYRGYTCGLWTTFHALTVSNYKNKGAEADFDPKAVLKSIRGWVGSFFGCEHCRQHFLKMTGKSFNMDDHIHKPEDSFLYLWRAHNIVNARLKGRDTEDPKFPKIQFPAHFLCKECQVGGDQQRDEQITKDYLLNYYSNIRPLI
ncbi:unnamed protein product [Bursaphelenchus xylophilus]|uniref:Sulfhydryl oxidase n=1 Tax=Bursaphelenchus xylophilus TaxID=6326 RepID=A0A7I8X428_BURXY|nr:unnamed protein product [Bursaphelenchus xylophilus]CAG9128622.1 unnamed protein product [Bursaphelenchus xylophilus]